MPILFIRDDITRVNADAIVNAANTTLLGGGGVDGAIHAAAGPELLEECRGLGGCETGQAKITGAYRLPSKYIIHTPGPIWKDGQHGEKELLADCYRNSLKLAEEYGCESIAFPMISAGAYGFPADEALRIAMDTVSQYPGIPDMTVYLTLFDHILYEIGDRKYRDVKSYVDDEYVNRHKLMYSRRQNIFPDGSVDADLTVGSAPCDGKKLRHKSKPLPMDGALPGIPKAATDYIKMEAPALVASEVDEDELRRILAKQDEGFSQMLLRMIDERGMTDPECYKRANMDRRHFNHIKNTPDYRPKKETVLALAVALKLNVRETENLLKRAGFALSDSDKRDRAIRYFISHRLYDINQINLILFDYDMPLLG